MHQYSLSGSSLEGKSSSSKPVAADLVLCKITLDHSKFLKIKQKKVEEIQLVDQENAPRLPETSGSCTLQENRSLPGMSQVVEDIPCCSFHYENEPNTLPMTQDNGIVLQNLPSPVFNTDDIFAIYKSENKQDLPDFMLDDIPDTMVDELLATLPENMDEFLATLPDPIFDDNGLQDFFQNGKLDLAQVP